MKNTFLFKAYGILRKNCLAQILYDMPHLATFFSQKPYVILILATFCTSSPVSPHSLSKFYLSFLPLRNTIPENASLPPGIFAL